MRATAGTNVCGLTPGFVSLALPGVPHRFILVLECESRRYEGEMSVGPPRFTVGAVRAVKDPRNVSMPDLLPLTKSYIDLPQGWEKIHEFLYVVQDSTDEQGWQYRSQWPQHALEASDERWTHKETSTVGVRWRLWMSTVVKREDVLEAKRRISGLLVSRNRGVILTDMLMRLEDKEWFSRRCALHDESIEITDEKGGFIEEVSIMGCQIKVLDGLAFSLSKLDGTGCIIFDTESKDMRRKWLLAISYQAAVRGPLIDFSPFPYAPPLGDIQNRVILCGDLLKKGLPYISWKTRFVKLTPSELQIYHGDKRERVVQLRDCVLKTAEEGCQMSLRLKNGLTIVLRTESLMDKQMWTKALDEHIKIQNSKPIGPGHHESLEEKTLRIQQGISIVIPSVVKREEDRTRRRLAVRISAAAKMGKTTAMVDVAPFRYAAMSTLDEIGNENQQSTAPPP